MSKIHDEINELIDSGTLFGAEIAEQVGCPVEMVNAVVEERWNKFMSAGESMSPYCTVNS